MDNGHNKATKRKNSNEDYDSDQAYLERTVLSISIVCIRFCKWFLFGILVLDGMAERNHCHIISFSFHCFNGFSVASWRIMQHVIEKPLPYN